MCTYCWMVTVPFKVVCWIFNVKSVSQNGNYIPISWGECEGGVECEEQCVGIKPNNRSARLTKFGLQIFKLNLWQAFLTNVNHFLHYSLRCLFNRNNLLQREVNELKSAKTGLTSYTEFSCIWTFRKRRRDIRLRNGYIMTDWYVIRTLITIIVMAKKCDAQDPLRSTPLQLIHNTNWRVEKGALRLLMV